MEKPFLLSKLSARIFLCPENQTDVSFFIMAYKAELLAPPQIEHAILLIRGQRVMLDRDLAAMYGVTTGNLNKAVRRNLSRFPADFMFQLTADEAEASRFQFGILKRGLNIKYLPYVFTPESEAQT